MKTAVSINEKIRRYLKEKACPRKHSTDESHKILSVPGRSDVWIAFCSGWGNRVFLLWQKGGRFFHKTIAGADGLEILVDEKGLKVDLNTLTIYCKVMYFLCPGGGVDLVFHLGKPGKADPQPGPSKGYCI